MKYLVFPKGYDPMIASGPPGDFCKKAGILWTEEETEHHKNLIDQAVTEDVKPVCQWYIELGDK